MFIKEISICKGVCFCVAKEWLNHERLGNGEGTDLNLHSKLPMFTQAFSGNLSQLAFTPSLPVQHTHTFFFILPLAEDDI